MAWSVGRVSSFQFNLTNRQNISQASIALQQAGQEVATGRRADIFADLGPAAAGALKLRAREDETQTYLMANELLGNKLSAMLTSIEAIRDQVQDVLEVALSNASSPANGAFVLQSQARAAMESVISTLNVKYNGEHLFAGTQSDNAPMMRWDEANPVTGLSPEDVAAGIAAAGLTDPASATGMAAEFDLVFSSSDAVNPDRNYEQTHYLGTPLTDGAGDPNNRVRARLSPGQELEYGVQANDPGIRDIIKGLSMLISTDVSTIEDETTYQEWMSHVIDALSSGQEGALDASTRIGFNQQVVETSIQRLGDLSVVHLTQIAAYESVDPYEAATRMTNLQTQLQASYEVAARLSSLSILSVL
ncbi:flagellin [Shimia sp.]|uniref:flagellin N-terminal helical domain-containing protein n=1 Tax=Shimia sp. TaxID=1954381 RepID=UPI0035658A7D